MMDAEVRAADHDQPTMHPPSEPVAAEATGAEPLSPDAAAEVVATSCPDDRYRGRRVLVIVPDGTRTAPVGLVFRQLFDHIGGAAAQLDVMVALGTHQPMDEAAICRRLEMTPEERRGRYRHVAFINHEWNNPAALQQIGVI